MKLSRRYQVLPAYAYCATPDCAWTDHGHGTPHSDAETHVEKSGHEVRVMQGAQIILTPDWAVARA